MDKTAFIALIDRFLRGETTEAENQFLDNYARSFQGADAWSESEQGSKQAFLNALLTDLQQHTQEQHPAPIHRIHFLRSRWMRYAAAIILLIAGISTVLILQPWKQPTQQLASQPVKDIQPGTNKAYITLGDGQRVTLNDLKVGERVGDAVKTADGKLAYTNPATQAVVFNTVTVPRGGVPQFVELPDHTLVWVNTASSITYPTAFTGDTREVKMTGQVYYEVAKEASGRKLYAQTRTDRIEVRGTHFDIRAYDDEPFVQTTLFEGSVKINDKMLVPGDQYEHGNIKKLNSTELDRVIAWKNGLFSYDKVDVQTLMRDLGRYYDMEVVFEGTPTKRTYEGKIGRSLSLKDVLEGLQFTELNYRLEKGPNGNRIVMLP